MPNETTTNFAFDRFLPLWAIVLIGVGLLAFSWWMARRDTRFADRPHLVWLLLLLRGVAVLVLLWILAGPTLVTTLRQFRTKSVAVLVDTSASMGLVDLIDGSGNVSRWAAAREDNGKDRVVRERDGAITTLRAAQLKLVRFSKLPDATNDSAAARTLFSQSVQGIRTGLQQLEQSVQDSPDAPAEMNRSFGDAGRVIKTKVIETLQEKADDFSRGRSLASLERERWLPERLALLSVSVVQMERLADQHTKALELALANSPGKTEIDESKVSRLDTVEAFISAAEQNWLRDIRKKATVMRYEFGEKVVPMGAAPWEEPKKTGGKPKALGAATQLGTALQQVALENNVKQIEAAILITDGGHNAGRDPRELAASLSGTTLHIVPIGNTRMQRDVILHHTHAPKAVFQKDTVVIDSIVTAYDCAKESLQVELLENETVVDRQTLNITGEVFDGRVQLRWKAANLGRHTLALRAVPVSDERSVENNATKVDVQVMDDKIRVLVADNFPRWETRYLLNLFKRDDRVDFEQLLFEPQRAAGEGVRIGFPTTLEEWAKYRVVILGDVSPSQLDTQQQNLLKQYITEAGGNVIVVAGKESMPRAFVNQPLASMLPVEVGGRALPANSAFYLHVSDEGSMALATQIAENPGTSERIWREMSERLPVYSLSEFSKAKPTTHSLIWASPNKTSVDPDEARTRSFLAWHYVGAGRVVYLAAPVTYQLRYREGDTYHHRFWGQLLRWAVARDLAEGSQTVRLSTDKLVYEAGDPIEVSLRLTQLDGKAVSGATCQVSASNGGRPVQEIVLKEDANRPGSYHAIFQQLPEGPVQLRVEGDRIKELLATENYRRPVETTINIDPSGSQELRHPLCNLSLLREIADASGGIVVPPTGLKAAMQQINLDPEVLENIAKKPLWNRVDLFLLFIVCLSLEWAGRKYLGLS